MGGWKLLLATREWEGVDRRHLDRLLPAHSPAAAFLRTVCGGPLLGGCHEVLSAGHVARLLGPSRTRLALTWHGLLEEGRHGGPEVLAHAVTTAAAARLEGDPSSDRHLTVGLAAAVALRQQLTEPVDLVRGMQVLSELDDPLQAAAERAVFGRSRHEHAQKIAWELGLPDELAELVAPARGSELAELARGALDRAWHSGDKWADLQRESRWLGSALGLKLVLPWSSPSEHDVEGDLSPIALALQARARELTGTDSRGRRRTTRKEA